jgi:hypothetical protein
VVADHHGDDECHRGIEPVPAAGGQDDRAGGCDAGRGRGVGDGVEQDRRDGQITATVIVIVGVGVKHEGADGHGQRGHPAHHQHGQTVHLRRPGREPHDGRGGHQHLEQQQPPAVEQGGKVRRARPPGPLVLTRGAGGHADGEHRYRRPSRIQQVVTAFGQHGE